MWWVHSIPLSNWNCPFSCHLPDNAIYCLPNWNSVFFGAIHRTVFLSAITRVIDKWGNGNPLHMWIRSLSIYEVLCELHLLFEVFFHGDGGLKLIAWSGYGDQWINIVDEKESWHPLIDWLRWVCCLYLYVSSDWYIQIEVSL